MVKHSRLAGLHCCLIVIQLTTSLPQTSGGQRSNLAGQPCSPASWALVVVGSPSKVIWLSMVAVAGLEMSPGGLGWACSRGDSPFWAGHWVGGLCTGVWFQVVD